MHSVSAAAVRVNSKKSQIGQNKNTHQAQNTGLRSAFSRKESLLESIITEEQRGEAEKSRKEKQIEETRT